MSRAVYRAAACFAKPAARRWKGCKRFPGARGKSVFFRSGSGQERYPSSAEAGRRTNAPMPPENLTRDPRVYLAAERTFLAWIRTGLSLMAFGFVIARFGLFLRALESSRGSSPIEPLALSMPLGVAFVLMGVLVNLFSSWQHVRYIHGLDQDSLPVGRPSRLAIFLALIVAVAGVVMACYLGVTKSGNLGPAAPASQTAPK